MNPEEKLAIMFETKDMFVLFVRNLSQLNQPQLDLCYGGNQKSELGHDSN